MPPDDLLYRSSPHVQFSFVLSFAVLSFYVGRDIAGMAYPAFGSNSGLASLVIIAVSVGTGVTVGQGFYTAWQHR
ncbi:MAG: hypothetical protein ACTHM6_16380 [Tepidisphaeraceae bacterium]